MPRKTRIKVKIERKERTKFRCRFCQLGFDSEDSKQKHILSCYKAKQTKSVIRCDKCSKNFIYKQSYLQHLRTEHSNLKTSVACKDCPVRCPSSRILKQHIMKVHENKKHPCPHCGLSFARIGHVMRHIKQSGCGGTDATKYSCEICDAEFSRKDNLMVHLRSMHIISSRYDCKYCPVSMKSFSRLITHVQYEHTENLSFECDTCGKSTGSKAALVKHMEIHGEKKHSCDVCGYTTFTAEVMRRHVLTHVIDKPYKCELCPCSFIQVSQLRHHIMNKHTNQFNCAICKKDFNKIEEFATHSQTHSDKPGLRCHFKGCSLGDKVFKTLRGLSVHLKKHFVMQTEVSAEHTCEVCNKSFSSEVLAKRHLSTHALDRPRRCMYCVQARAYVRGQQLLRHVRKCHHAVFMAHLMHVRRVLGGENGITMTCERLRKSEAESILNVMDAEAERILHGYGAGVLYGGMMDDEQRQDAIDIEVPAMEETESWAETSAESESTADVTIEVLPAEDKQASSDVTASSDSKPLLLSESQLADKLDRLLQHLVDHDTLADLGWPDQPVEQVLEQLISQCGVSPGGGGGGGGGRACRLRRCARLLFLHVLEDAALAAMLATHTVDQLVTEILRNVADEQV